MDHGLNVRAKTTIYLRKNKVEVHLCDCGLTNVSLDMMPKSTIKESR